MAMIAAICVGDLNLAPYTLYVLNILTQYPPACCRPLKLSFDGVAVMTMIAAICEGDLNPSPYALYVLNILT